MNDSDKTKEQLIQEIELLRTLIDTLPDRLYVKDEKGRFVICNKAVAEDTDLPLSGDPIGKSDFDLFPPELADFLYAAEQEIIKTGKPIMNEEVRRTRRKDGQESWSLCTKLPWRDKNGNIIGIIGANRDITEEKKAELALLESETKYKAIFESAREGIIVGIIETRQFTYTNPAICKMFGYTAEELTRLTVSDIHPKDQLQYVSGRFEALMRNEVAFTQNIPCLRKNGTIFYADISATRIVINNKACFVGFFTDTTERKHAEEALCESEARYKAIFESAKEGIVVTDIETKRFIYSNPAICKMFGYTEEELSRMSINDIHRKEYQAEAIRHFEDMTCGKRELSHNVPCLRKDGTIFYADVNATIVSINNKLCNVGLFTDITERKHAEEALRESEARYKAIFDYATEGIIVADIETKRFKYANQAACRMFGCTAEQLRQMTVYDAHPKEYMPYVIAGFKAQARGEKTLVPNVPCLRKDGTVFYANINTTRVVIDQRPCNVGLFTNITERKNAEDALRESEEKYRGLADRNFDMIFMTDAHGFIKYLSPACKRIFGYKPEEMVGKKFTNFLIESEIPKATKRFTEKLQGKKLDVLYLEAKKKNGSRVFIELNSSLVIQDGKINGTQGIIKDVTERRKAEEQLRKAQEELEVRVKQRTADLAGVVKDLQNEIAERKRAEESLRNAEERFRTIFENTIVGLYRTTPDGRILLANPALIKMMGCRSFKELAKFNVEKNGFDPSTPRSIFKERIKKEGRITGLEFVWRRPDGTKLFVSESAFAVKDGKGKILYYEGTAQDITKRKEAEAKLMLYQQQLRSLASELSLAEERLRRRIAAELHDHIAQNLAISKIKLESLADNAEPDLFKSLNEVNGLISQTIEATRSLTFEISPPVLYELGFETAVNWLAKQTRKRFGLEVEFADDGKPKPLDADIRVLLFQAVRELLVNVVKHARAKKAKVFTCRIQKNIQITVEDNGVGFDAEAISAVNDPAKGGFGLFNIRERLDQIGGSVIINARAGKGTRITLTAPVEKQEKPRTRFAGTRPDKNRKRRKKNDRSA
jgi:PAS domain S-box-containing protein